MLDAEIKNATCQVTCGKDYGTGILVSPDTVLTARHCIIDAIEEPDTKITLSFRSSNSSEELKATILDHDENADICLLSLERANDITPIVLKGTLPVEGEEFYAYGWPVSKLVIGHRLEGTISQCLAQPQLGMNVDLHIKSSAKLTNYQGFSGAALICDGVCSGIIRIAVDNTIGAISMESIGNFLRKHEVLAETAIAQDSRNPHLASREDFAKKLDSLIADQSGGYIFIEGTHGIGKSTFCKTYVPTDPAIKHFDTYSLTSEKDAVNAALLAQPQEFYDWLSMQVSMFLTQQPGRTGEKSYPRIVKEIETLLKHLGEAYIAHDKIGVLFIDGIDEVQKLGGKMLEEFIGLLPAEAPKGLSVVLSAPSYSQLSARLGTRVNSESCLSMPLLGNSVARVFCHSALTEDRSSYSTIQIICGRAQGHPLYLRYLIDLVNSGADDSELASLPLIDGSIRVYYDALWSQLQEDPEAVNLLAIIARLRWGVSLDQLSEVLNQTELAVMVNTLDRIRHLLLVPNETTIHHSSFSDFLIEKTELREHDIQKRLAEYCETHKDDRYGLLNLIYHGLKSETDSTNHVISLCNQSWVDKCVTQGVEPDILLSDINDVLAKATGRGDLVETARILLLSQRLQFRYDILFAQSAGLTANALIALGKTKEVLKHVIRYGCLMIPVSEALTIAHKLITANDLEAGLKLLNIVEGILEEQLFSNINGMSIHDFLELFDLQVQQLAIKVRAIGPEVASDFFNFTFFWMDKIKEMFPDDETNSSIRSVMVLHMQAACMCLWGRYQPVAEVRQNYTGPVDDLLGPLRDGLFGYHLICNDYQLTPNNNLLDAVFDDLQTIVEETQSETEEVHINIIDAMIALGMPSNTIEMISGKPNIMPPTIQFIADNNVSMDEAAFQEGMAEWRFESLTNADLACPSLVLFSPFNWKDGVDSICKILAWCDGRARRAKESNDTKQLEAVWAVLQEKVLSQLKFTLAQRAKWETSYALPEAVFPRIYQQLASLVIDIFPGHISDLLAFIEDRFSSQYGLYSEGFRDVLARVLEKVTRIHLEDDVEDQAFSLTERWREFVQKNLKNRHELVPELLAIIPLFVRLGATEEAQRSYQSVLAFSMGPNWYKEDQFGLMTSAMSSVGDDTALETGTLSQIAGFLDAAAGEMTFQRFVRYAKSDFIAALCARGDYGKVSSYFMRQTYGSPEQLLQEAKEGEIDRVSPLRGTRFPGGALDEQDAILRIVRSAIPVIDWKLCWSLLEIFQFGDSRHLTNYGKAYAQLVNLNQGDGEAVAAMMKRLKLICESEVEKEQCSDFLSSVSKELPSELVEKYEALFGVYSPLNDPATDSNPTSAQESESQPQQQESRDELFFPGVFGTKASIAEAKEAFSRAERYLKRRNKSEAQKEVITGLEAIQKGEWSIWSNLMSEASKAKKMLLQTTDSTSEVIKSYSALILNERHDDRWLIANQLIEWLGERCTQEEQAALVKVALEHISIMIDFADHQIQSYDFLEKTNGEEISSCFMQLILHAVDHPTWLRSEKAAEMLLWLLRMDSEYILEFGPQAFSMNSNNHPDVLCGVLDQLSNIDSIQLWDQLAPALDIVSIKKDCMHAGRLSVLIHIVNRAAKNGSNPAAKALTLLEKDFPTSAFKSNSSSKLNCPQWAESIMYQWSRLTELGLACDDLIKRASEILKKECLPLPWETNLELEQLLAEGARGNPRRPGRWEAKVRFAFQVALLPVSTLHQLPQIEDIFRPYNPTRIEGMRVVGFSSPALNWLEQMESIKPISGEDIYLDYYERIWQGEKMVSVRLTAYFYDKEKDLPLPSGRFFSTDEPTTAKNTQWDTCSNVIGLPAYFGGFTPAIPTSDLIKYTGASGADFTRSHWKSGRFSESLGGGPEHEGCSLAIKEDALKLPFGFSLAWVYEIDGQPVSMITTN